MDCSVSCVLRRSLSQTVRTRQTGRVVLSFLLLSCFTITGAFAEVERISNTVAARAPRTVHLAEMWRVGGDDSDLMFGLMVEALSDDEGNVYLMDQQLCQVTVVSQTGEVLRTLGREGEGPGEVRTPQGIALMPDGTIGIAEQFPGKFVKLTLDGQPVETVTVGRGGTEGGYMFVAGCRSRDGRLLLAGQFSAPVENGQSRNTYIAKISGDGEELVRYRENTVILDFQKAHFTEAGMIPPFMAANALGPDGRVYLAETRNDYAIEVYLPDGTLAYVVEREFVNPPRDERTLNRMNALFEVQARNLPFDITWEVEPSDQTVSALQVMDDGNLWVMHNRSTLSQPDGIMQTYDVYDSAGKYLQEVAIASDADPTYDGLIFLGDDRVLLVKGLILAMLTSSGSQGAIYGEEDEESSAMEIICCRMID